MELNVIIISLSLLFLCNALFLDLHTFLLYLYLVPF